MSALHRATLALLSFSLFACDQPPTVTSPTEPRFDFLEGPTVLPNLFRTEANIGISVPDPESGLLVFAGLPNPPSSLVRCGGTVPFDPVSIQSSGELRDVLQDLRIARGITISVFYLSSFRGPCASTPFAVGQGMAMRTDNDLLTSLTRANTFAMRVSGDVSAANGDRYHVNADLRFVVLPDFSFKTVVQSVNLVPIGAP
jgi:hypothetical protein